MPVLHKETPVEVPAEELFAWHSRPGAFERLAPPWERVRVIERKGGMRDGGTLVLETSIGPFRARWNARHTGFEEGRWFRDVQESGPFAQWEHTHSMTPAGPDRSTLTDHVEYQAPFGALGALTAGGYLRRKLDRIFAFRQARTKADAEFHRALNGGRPMRFAVTGATGLTGSSLVPFLTAGGHSVLRMVRREPAGPDEVFWDPEAGRLDPAALNDLDAVIHLAGENIAGRRWSAAQKVRILESRERGTRLVAEAAAKAARPPRALVCASAVGFYGPRGEEPLDETAESGGGFLAEVCRRWEASTLPAKEAGVRVVHARFGVILTPAGGALAKMLPPFLLGLGGPLGTGRQWMSWIGLDDAISALAWMAADPGFSGPVNAVAPEPVPNAEFTEILARVVRRPAVFPMPAFAARLAFGEVADEILLTGQKVVPAKLAASGFRFRHPALETALRSMLGRTAKGAAPSPTTEQS